MRLYFGATRLFDDVSVVTVGVTSGSTLQVLVMLRGGGWPAFFGNAPPRDLDVQVKAAACAVMNTLFEMSVEAANSRGGSQA